MILVTICTWFFFHSAGCIYCYGNFYAYFTVKKLPITQYKVVNVGNDLRRMWFLSMCFFCFITLCFLGLQSKCINLKMFILSSWGNSELVNQHDTLIPMVFMMHWKSKIYWVFENLLSLMYQNKYIQSSFLGMLTNVLFLLSRVFWNCQLSSEPS